MRKRYLMSSIFESTGKFQLDESAGETKEKDPRVDGENIIGSVEGVFFVPNGFSRNNRFYPCELWQRQLSDEDINRRLDNSIMFGCIGHSTGPVTEQDLSEGKVSHIMDKLWIDEASGMGMGKAYILNTPAGRNLKTYLKAGSNLKVSSRGEGSFAEGVEKDGHPVVEADSYNLITFDFVIEPGFTETNPQIMENYIEEVLIKDNKEEVDSQTGKETSMNLEKILEEYKSERDSARKSLEEVKSKHSEEVSELKNEISSLTKQLQENAKKAEIKSSRIKRLQGVLESYSCLGSAEDIAKASAISRAAIQELKSYKSLGTLQELREALTTLVKVSNSLQEYKKLGSLKSIKELLAMSERFVTLQQRQKIMDEAKKLSTDSGKAIEEVAKMIEEQGVEKTKQILAETLKKEKDKEIDVILEVKEEETKKEPTKKIGLVESIFEDTCSKMFITEEDEDEEEPPVVKPKEGTEEDSEEDEEEDIEGTEEDSEEDEEEDIEGRVDNLEDKVDNVQAQVDTLLASFDKMSDEDIEDSDEDAEDFDFEIEN